MSATDDNRLAVRRTEDRQKIERVSVRGLLAMLLAGFAAILAVAALWLQHGWNKRLEAVHTQQTELTANLGRLREDINVSGSQAQANAKRLKELDKLTPRLDELRISLTELRQRAESGQRGWILAEARYLLEIANRRAVLERDIGSALAAMEAADARLQMLRDPSLTTVRRTLASEMQALRSLVRPDLDGISLRLASAERAVATLPVLGAIADRYRPEATEADSAPGFARAWQLFRSSITNMISIRRIGKDAVELVSMEEQEVRRHHLQLLLFAARLAAMRNDQNTFHSNIEAARSWLSQMFDPRDGGVAGLHEELRQLSQLDIEPKLPDISTSSHQLEQLTHPAQGAP